MIRAGQTASPNTTAPLQRAGHLRPDDDVVVNGEPVGLTGYAAGLQVVIDAFGDYPWQLQHLLIDGPWLSAPLRAASTAKGRTRPTGDAAGGFPRFRYPVRAYRRDLSTGPARVPEACFLRGVERAPRMAECDVLFVSGGLRVGCRTAGCDWSSIPARRTACGT
jgi:hypothetical protein